MTTSNIFARARAYASLTPAERALLKLIEGLICAALVAALPIVAEALSRGGVDWSSIMRAALAAASVAILMALTKYARAQADPALADALLAPEPAPVPAPNIPAAQNGSDIAPIHSIAAVPADAALTSRP
ncbi:MAG TPA: hypothetical protein VLJ14_16015 [Ktedonobacterales bacterium]|jgi:hypothetical protein|nr:hypothetical protein [Ktedonobacterales bacterium]